MDAGQSSLKKQMIQGKSAHLSEGKPSEKLKLWTEGGELRGEATINMGKLSRKPINFQNEV
jgi:hypothetical protein